MPVADEREPVTVVDIDEPEPEPRKPRAGIATLMEAIQKLPDEIAARLDGSTAHTEDGAPEVTFVGDPLPLENAEGEPDLNATTPVDPELHHPKFGHPSARRRTVEAIA